MSLINNHTASETRLWYILKLECLESLVWASKIEHLLVLPLWWWWTCLDTHIKYSMLAWEHTHAYAQGTHAGIGKRQRIMSTRTHHTHTTCTQVEWCLEKCQRLMYAVLWETCWTLDVICQESVVSGERRGIYKCKGNLFLCHICFFSLKIKYGLLA